jgi:hypothetical protein
VNEVLREEKKFLISQDKMYLIWDKLAEVMPLDSHGDSEGYSIRSLYFDSLHDRDFTEKEDGIELRRKIRLRNYSPYSDFAMLEMKQKQGQYQKKRSLKLKKEDALELINANYSVLLKQNTDFANECFYMMNQFQYRPKAVVTYKRKAFVAKENSIRITFDHHLKGTESYYNIFDPEINENYIMDPYLAVMEVKFNGFLLSYIKDVIDMVDLPETSVSKYYKGRLITQYALS